jgi:hypothetical protein
MSLLVIGDPAIQRGGLTAAAVRDCLRDLLHKRTYTYEQAAILTHGYYSTVPYHEVKRMAAAIARCDKVQWLDPKQQASPPEPFL